MAKGGVGVYGEVAKRGEEFPFEVVKSFQVFGSCLNFAALRKIIYLYRADLTQDVGSWSSGSN